MKSAASPTILALAAVLAALFALFLAAGSAFVFAALLASFTCGQREGHREHSGGEGEFDDVFHGVYFLGFSLLFVVCFCLRIGDKGVSFSGC